MPTFRKVCPMLVVAIVLAGCKAPVGRETPVLPAPEPPLACGGGLMQTREECAVYKVQRYENLPLFSVRGFDGKMHERLGFRMVLETPTIRLRLTCAQDVDLPPPPACGQGMLLAGEVVWARKGASGETLYVYSNETPQHKRTVSFWMIDRSEAK